MISWFFDVNITGLHASWVVSLIFVPTNCGAGPFFSHISPLISLTWTLALMGFYMVTGTICGSNTGTGGKHQLLYLAFIKCPLFSTGSEHAKMLLLVVISVEFVSHFTGSVRSHEDIHWAPGSPCLFLSLMWAVYVFLSFCWASRNVIHAAISFCICLQISN